MGSLFENRQRERAEGFDLPSLFPGQVHGRIHEGVPDVLSFEARVHFRMLDDQDAVRGMYVGHFRQPFAGFFHIEGSFFPVVLPKYFHGCAVRIKLPNFFCLFEKGPPSLL